MLGRTPVHQVAARALQRLSLLVAAVVIATGASLSDATPAAAAGPKVVVVIGPSDGATALYLRRGRAIARTAHALGASVTLIATPYATWSRVVRASRGANVFIYLGHGNGSPSPYGPLNTFSMNGLGLNPRRGHGKTHPVKYYGEAAMAAGLRLAPGAVVLLHHLCYASGNGEPGMAEPGWSVARRRVDNFAAGFLRAGARAVLADAHGSLGYELRSVLRDRGTLLGAWRRDLEANQHERRFASRRTRGFILYMDPDGRSSGFYRSLVTTPDYSPRSFRRVEPVLSTITGTPVHLRARPSTAASSRGVISADVRLDVIGRLVRDGQGRSWVVVRTATGRYGYVAAWLTRIGGPARISTPAKMRASASTASRSFGTLSQGRSVQVLGSWADRRYGVWLKIQIASGRVGWVASWLMSA